jgi:hypothetical protein
MTYHKQSTKRVVKRAIDPLRIKGNLLLAFDHKRKALRSFHLDGVRTMEKKSSFWEGAGNAAKRTMAKNPRMTGALVGGGLYGGMGAAATSDFAQKHDKKLNDKIELSAHRKGIKPGSAQYKDHEAEIKGKYKKFVPLGMGAYGAALGAGLGHAFGASGAASHAHRAASKAQTVSELHKAVGLSGKEVSKVQAKKAFHAAARKHHPDLGGSPDKMKEINSAWDKIQDSFWFKKLAFIEGTHVGNGFWAGFEKNANAAAELAGLGMLAVPSVQHLRGKPMSEGTKSKIEIAGLGTLAAPYAWQAGKKLLSRGK